MQASTTSSGLAYTDYRPTTDVWKRPSYELLNAYKNASALQVTAQLMQQMTAPCEMRPLVSDGFVPMLSTERFHNNDAETRVSPEVLDHSLWKIRSG
jgi:hypothetical protein